MSLFDADFARKPDPSVLTVGVGIDFREADPGLDDLLDANGDRNNRLMHYDLSLTGDAVRPFDTNFASDPDLKMLTWQEENAIQRIGDNHGGDNDEDFGVQVRGADNIPQAFLSKFTPLAVDPFAGLTCYGGPTCG